MQTTFSGRECRSAGDGRNTDFVIRTLRTCQKGGVVCPVGTLGRASKATLMTAATGPVTWMAG